MLFSRDGHTMSRRRTAALLLRQCPLVIPKQILGGPHDGKTIVEIAWARHSDCSVVAIGLVASDAKRLARKLNRMAIAIESLEEEQDRNGD